MSEIPILKFKVSAPGKVILHGEHSVVYGKSALAGVIGARNRICIEENDSDTIKFNFENLSFEILIKVDDINKLLKVCSNENDDNNLDHKNILEKISYFMKNNFGKDILSNKAKENALTSFLYLLVGIFLENNIKILSKSFQGVLNSEIKIGAGLGSSASFGVCLAAMFFILSRKSINYILTQTNKEFISKWAFNSEKIMHGEPSGVDNTVCTFGNIVKFSKGQKPQQIIPKSEIKILLVDTNVDRSTSALVSKVAALKNEFPKLIDHILCAMDDIVQQAIKLYETISVNDKEGFNKLEKLFQINNDLLKSIGASHQNLEEVFSYATKFGFSSKLTGAGGGGFVIIPLKFDYKTTNSFQSLCNELKQSNYEITETTIGGDGLILQWL